MVTKRWDVLNHLIEKFGFTDYLEIGVQSGMCFDNVKCKNKTGVDPAVNEKTTSKTALDKTHVMTSDAFFEKNETEQQMFDLIFVDGLHEADQVFKDITNGLIYLKDGGIIVCHDMLPTEEKAQQVPRVQQIWNGDCWQAFVKLRASRPDLDMCTLDTDWGLGCIGFGEQELIDIEGIELNWDNFKRNRNVWMNVMTVDQFYEMI